MQAARRTPLTAEEVERSAQKPAPGETLGTAGRKLPVVIGVALTVLVLDVITKLFVVHALSGHAPIRLLGGILTLLLLRNSGAAFSIGTSMTIVFTAIAVAVIFYILRAARKLRSLSWAITLGLLLGGATGNLADRIFRSPGLFRGDVVDWIELPHWPVFNLADSAIVCGGVLAVLLALRGVRLDGSREVVAGPGGPDPDSTVQDGTGQDGTVQDGTVQDGTVQDDAGDGDDGARPALYAGARGPRR